MLKSIKLLPPIIAAAIPQQTLLLGLKIKKEKFENEA
jgi:hypothetical protein